MREPIKFADFQYLQNKAEWLLISVRVYFLVCFTTYIYIINILYLLLNFLCSLNLTLTLSITIYWLFIFLQIVNIKLLHKNLIYKMFQLASHAGQMPIFV